MSHNANESLLEKCQEEIENDPMEAVVCDDQAQTDFLIWLDNYAPSAVFQKLLNGWLETKTGQAFMERSVQKLFENRQDAGDEHDR